jgi:putative hydrolase of the HAD superfamily
VIEAVLFDLDDTLLDGDRAWQAGVSALLPRCPQVDPAAARQAWRDSFQAPFDRYLAGELTLDESRVERIRAWAELIPAGLAAGAELAWYRDYQAAYEAGWATYDDVESCLTALAGFRLGVITNGEGDQQRAKLAALGLASRFEVVVISGDAGVAKPDPRIFRLAADRLGLPPDRCFYTGDKLDTDARGALAAGMRAAWLNRRGGPRSDDGTPEITTLAQIRPLLG